MKSRLQIGMTLVELFIALVACAIVVTIVFGYMDGGSYSFGLGGLTEVRCIDGYKYVLLASGKYTAGVTQMRDENGKPITCTK